MKQSRHAKILELIERFPIDTQEELAERLKDSGFEVTQATVSRDIKELRLIKVSTVHGGVCYATIAGEKGQPMKFRTLFIEGTLKIETAMNLVIIKTLTGMAQAVAAAVDTMDNPLVVGTIAGDDTIMVATKSVEDAQAVCENFRNLLQ